MNLCETASVLIRKAVELSAKGEQFKVDSETLNSFETFPKAVLRHPNLELIQCVKRVWDDPGVQAATREQSSETQVLESARYFFNERIEKILDPEYLPTDEV